MAVVRALLGPGSQRDPLGSRGEAAASRFLRKKKYRVLARNVRVRFGEADLLCLAPDRRTVVVVEVKTRRVESADARPYLPPEASITHEKRKKLTAVLMHLARANRWQDRPLRVDAVGVEWPEKGKPVIRHHEGVVRVNPRAHMGAARGAHSES
jgi:putative endonuclease